MVQSCASFFDSYFNRSIDYFRIFFFKSILWFLGMNRFFKIFFFSLLISTPEKGSHTRSKIIVEEDDDDRYLNTNSYRKSYKKKLWSEEGS